MELNFISFLDNIGYTRFKEAIRNENKNLIISHVGETEVKLIYLA